MYQTGAWGTNEEGFGCSGTDSTYENSLVYIAFLENFIKQNSIKKVVDIGCGDWSFSNKIKWDGIEYIGIDIVKPVIDKNTSLYSNDHISFVHCDIGECQLPEADLLICKDVLSYLTQNQIVDVIKKTDKFKYCLFINDINPNPQNRVIVCGDHRPLDLNKAPFFINGINIFKFQADNSNKEVLLTLNENKRFVSRKNCLPRCFVVNQIHPFQGFFSVFNTVLNYLDLYDKNEIAGLVIDFKNQGLFFDEPFGTNYWDYYFKPISLGIIAGQNVEYDYSAAIETGRISYLSEIGLSRERAAELINKYVQVKPEIKKEVDQFVEKHFQNRFVIGVHFRGTDKNLNETNRVDFDNLCLELHIIITQKKLDDYLIFVATDEERFLKYMEVSFPGKIISQNCLRSENNDPLHYFNPKNISPKKLGQEALIDCLLLSRCNELIRTSSCLSLVSSYFNPKLPTTLLNERAVHCYGRF